MKKHTWFFSAIAALALVIFSFSGCDAGLTDGVASDVDPSRSVTVQADLTGTIWLGNIKDDYGVTRIEFTTSTDATGVLGNTDHRFVYNLVSPSQTQYSLAEPGTGYTWTFNINGNDLTFSGSFKPYSDDPGTFRRITFQTSADLTNLAGTNWLARGPRGESELYDITATGTGTYSLIGAFGPDTPGEFAITDYTYNAGTRLGSGEMSRGAGPFNTDGSTATMRFPTFWGHADVTFNKFVFN